MDGIGSGGTEKGTAKMLAGNGERRGALRARSSSIVCTYVCVCVWFLRIRAEFLIKLKLLIDSLRGCSTHVPVLPGVPTIRDYSDFPPPVLSTSH